MTTDTLAVDSRRSVERSGPSVSVVVVARRSSILDSAALRARCSRYGEAIREVIVVAEWVGAADVGATVRPRWVDVPNGTSLEARRRLGLMHASGDVVVIIDDRRPELRVTGDHAGLAPSSVAIASTERTEASA